MTDTDEITTLRGEVEGLRDALGASLQCLDIMAERALTSGLEGTRDWDCIVGPSDFYNARETARAALGDR